MDWMINRQTGLTAGHPYTPSNAHWWRFPAVK